MGDCSVFHRLRLFIAGIAFVFLGIGAISLKFLVGEDARLPFWPFDGIAAIAGGVFVSWWSLKASSEPEPPPRDPSEI
jgi:hypothetical protein